MIHSIINSDGLLVYSGDITNEKFNRLKVISGNSVVESCPFGLERVDGISSKDKWDGINGL